MEEVSTIFIYDATNEFDHIIYDAMRAQGSFGEAANMTFSVPVNLTNFGGCIIRMARQNPVTPTLVLTTQQVSKEAALVRSSSQRAGFRRI